MTARLCILTALDRVNPHLIPERSLFVDVNLVSGAAITPTGFHTALQELELKHQVVSVTDADKTTRYRITDAGRAELAQYS